MSNHTPGPWVLCFGDDDADTGVVFATSQLIGGCIPSYDWDDAIAYIGRNHPDHEANARLIAAAPELLEALRGMLAIQDSVTQGQERELRAEWLPKARKILAALKGETK